MEETPSIPLIQEEAPKPRPHVWRTGILIGIVLSIVSGIAVFAWQQTNIGSLRNTIQELENDVVQFQQEVTISETEKQEILNKNKEATEQLEALTKKTSTYKNLIYGFELTLPAEFDGYWTNQESGDSTRGEQMIRFYVDASGTTWPNEAFDPMVVSIYPKGWWAKNAQVNEFDVAYIKGVDQTLDTHLGTFIGANEQYVITGFTGVHDCPTSEKNKAEADALCELPSIATDNIFNTFKEIDIF